MKIIHLDVINSTNEYLTKNVNTFNDMTFVSTSYQTQGKGREERLWLSNKDENLLFSFLIKEETLIGKYKSISLLISVCVAKALEHFGLKGIYIKWPNDVYVNDKKICGILLSGQLPNYLIVGVGININQKDFLGDYRTTPTSYLLETAKKLDINVLKKYLYELISSELDKLKNGSSAYYDYVSNHDYLKNKTRSVVLEEKEQMVNVIKIDTDNSLVVEKDNKIYHLVSGEVN